MLYSIDIINMLLIIFRTIEMNVCSMKKLNNVASFSFIWYEHSQKGLGLHFFMLFYFYIRKVVNFPRYKTHSMTEIKTASYVNFYSLTTCIPRILIDVCFCFGNKLIWLELVSLHSLLGIWGCGKSAIKECSLFD